MYFIVVDNFLDSKIFDLLDGVSSEVNLQFLTSLKAKRTFTSLFNDYKQQHSGVEARTYKGTSHDRYIYIDDQTIYHLGNSFNGIGHKAFRINQITSDEEVQKFKNDLDIWWSSGTVI